MTTHIPSSLKSNGTFSALSLLLVATLIVFGALICIAGQRSLEMPDVGGYSAPALFNQANADARSGNTALAIVGYERAKLLAPSDENVRANLNWTRTHAGLPLVSQNWWDRAVSWASPSTMAWLGALGVILMGTAWVLARPHARGRKLLNAASLAGMALLALAIMSAVSTWQTSRQAVVLTTDTPARISPTTMSEVSFKLRAGEIATIRSRHGDFVLIADGADHTGWVKRKDLEPIMPGQP